MMNSKKRESFGVRDRSEVIEAYLLAKLLTPADISKQLLISPTGEVYNCHLDREAKFKMLRDSQLEAIISFQTIYNDGIIEKRAEVRAFKNKLKTTKEE